MSISTATLAARRDPALRALNDYLGSHRETASWSRLVVEYFGEDALNVLGTAQEE